MESWSDEVMEKSANPNTPSSQHSTTPPSSMVRSTGALGAATMASRVLGLVREMVYASFMGQGGVASAFFIAFTIPNLLRRLLGEGALSAAFVPVFTDRLQRDGRAAAWRAANSVASVLAVGLVGVTVLAVIVLGMLLTVSPETIQHLLVRFAELFHAKRPASDGAATIPLILRLSQVMFPYTIFACLGAMAMGMLNALRHFFVPAFSPVLLNIALIGSVFLICPFFGSAPEQQVFGLAVGVLIGGVFQLAYQLPQLWREGWRPCWHFDCRDETVRQVAKLLAPSVIGVVAYQINVVVGRLLGLAVGDYVPAALNYADRLMELPQGVFGVSLATYMLPTLSAIATRGAMEDFRVEIGRALRFLMTISVPATVGLIVLGEPIVRLLFERGRFDAESTRHCAFALQFSVIGLTFYSSTSILARAFYAMKNTKTPMYVALASMVANIAFSLCLMWPLKEGGLALSNSLSAVLNATLLFILLRRRIGSLHGGALASAAARIALAALIMAAACWGAHHWLAARLAATTLTHNLVLVLVPIAVGAAVYFAAAFVLAGEEMRAILRSHRRS